MVSIGIIGTGSIGSMLVRKFIQSGAVSPDNLAASNKSLHKLKLLAEETKIIACESNRDLAERSDLIFICVRPLEVKEVIFDIRPCLSEDKLIVSVASDVFLNNLSKWAGTGVVRVIPSITSECLAGISGISFGDNVPEALKEKIISLFGSISRPFVTEEENLQLVSDIASSSPAIIASVIQEFAMAAVRSGGISKDDAELLLEETFIGTAGLFSEKGFDFNSLISSVSTKGGITAEGVSAVREDAPSLFDNVLLKMSKKHEAVREKVDSGEI